ncbi:MAG TPA: DUF5719 family protein [Acidimicrobiales bacterium]|nr:DUF5719 family protein [Acidimicrobiales bacterium]
MTTPAVAERRPRRGPAVVVTALVLGAAALAGTLLSASPSGAPPAAAMPSSTPGAFDAAWYCAGATAASGGYADGQLIITNGSDRNVTGSVSVVPNQGAAHGTAVSLGPHSTGVVKESTVATGPFVGAVVVLRGPETAVQQVVSGPLGTTSAPCSSRPSDAWYFAGGTTARGVSLVLALFNPFPQDAVVDLSFATDAGPAAPGPFQGLFVPAGTLLTVDLGQHVVEQAHVSTTVVARVGRVVAQELQIDSRSGSAGISLALGAAHPTGRWSFADGEVGPGLTEAYRIYDPGPRDADVEVDITLDRGQIDPFHLHLAAGTESDLVASSEPRIPPGDAHSAVIRSLNGVGIVASRAVTATSPAPHGGAAVDYGATVAARHWVMPSGGPYADSDQWITVYNPSPVAASLSIVPLDGATAVGPVQGILLAPGARTALRLSDHVDRATASVLLDSTVAVVAGRETYLADRNGIGLTPGVPFVG